MTASRIYLLIAAAVFLIDRLLKFIVFNIPSLASGVFMIDNIFGLGVRLNRAFVWSLPVANTVAAGLSLVILIGLAIYCFRRQSLPSSLALIFAGAVSNLIDRFMFGGVLDYILLPLGGATNLADMLIFIGVILLLMDNRQVVSETNKPIN